MNQPVFTSQLTNAIPLRAALTADLLLPPPARRPRIGSAASASLFIHALFLAVLLLWRAPESADPLDLESISVTVIATDAASTDSPSDTRSDATETTVASGQPVIAVTAPTTPTVPADVADTVPATVDEPTPVVSEVREPAPPEVPTAPPVSPLPAPTSAEAIATVATEQAPGPSTISAEAAQPAGTEPADAPSSVAVSAPDTMTATATVAEPVVASASVAEPATAAPVVPEAPTPAPTIPAEEAVSPTTTVAVQPANSAMPLTPTPEESAAKPQLTPAKPSASPKPTTQPRPTLQKPDHPRPQQASSGSGGKSDANAQAAAPLRGGAGHLDAGGSAADSRYPGLVQARLKRALRFPAGADRSQGEVHVQFTVAANGSASGITVVASSGSPILDQAAADTVRRAAPFPPIPADAGRSTWTFTMPLRFRR